MRDPDRIKNILAQLELIWKEHPELRLAQLIGNLTEFFIDIGVDSYYMEDQEFLNELRRLYEHNKTSR